jgi:2-oxoacid:acceptor oxidoreductase gamma subunit (pyruvate/2-ketoisovalerate family)
MKEIRIHGRGGQGAVIASEMLAGALLAAGKYAASFPMFSGQRRGAPVMAFLRFDDKPIREKTQIYNPHCLIITDPAIATFPRVYEGLREGGIAVINSTHPLPAKPHPNIKTLAYVDATGIALQELGIPVTNTCMMGTFAGVTGWVPLEPVYEALKMYFHGDPLKRNMKAAERGSREFQIVEY